MSQKLGDKANVAVLRMAVEKSYYDHANPGLLSRIPTNSATVLELAVVAVHLVMPIR